MKERIAVISMISYVNENGARRDKEGLARFLCPDLWQRNLADIDVDELRAMGIRSVILDIDNTLAFWGKSDIEDAVSGWIHRAKAAGLKLCIVSNNVSSRIKAISDMTGIPAALGGLKPFPSAFKKALTVLGTDPQNTAVVGDQLFTDILGGNLCGMFTILVAPLSRNEFITTRIVRRLERVALKWLLARGIISPEDLKMRQI